MEPNFKLETGGYTVFKFPSGEVQVTVGKSVRETCNNIITGSVLSSDNLMELLQLVEALRFEENHNLRLVMPYCAYSRQDRRCNPGESFSLGVFAKLINSCNFDSVTMHDNHSDVATALINNCTSIPVRQILPLDMYEGDYDYFVSPDAGANKKVQECSKRFNVPMIRADKVRETSTGKILETVVYTDADQLKDSTVLLIDDIVAGGRTFIEIAKALKAIEPSVTIHLYCTHGFFSKGLHDLRAAGITKFITTDSVYPYTEPTVLATDMQIINL